jgi:hypothetical protein
VIVHDSRLRTKCWDIFPKKEFKRRLDDSAAEGLSVVSGQPYQASGLGSPNFGKNTITSGQNC